MFKVSCAYTVQILTVVSILSSLNKLSGSVILKTLTVNVLTDYELLPQILYSMYDFTRKNKRKKEKTKEHY